MTTKPEGDTSASGASNHPLVDVPDLGPAEVGEEVVAEASGLEAFLPEAAVKDLSVTPPAQASPGLRSARLVGLSGRTASVLVRGDEQAREIGLDPDVDTSIVLEALENGERVMVEEDEVGELVVVGVLRSRQPDKIKISASVVEIEGDREVLIRSGKGALRIREDGDIEIVGSRISAASRGLFRLVGRMLRLN